MFERFGGMKCREFIEEYRHGKISAAECFRRECAACGEVDKRELDAYIDSKKIDSTFPAFVNFCKLEGFGCTIVSDGMDYYIQRILDREGLGEVKVFSNKLHFASPPHHPRPLLHKEGRTSEEMVIFSPEFPHESESCDRCACCKRNILLTNSGDDDILVLIGEGYSDRCPAPYADMVFAKDNLLTYCRQEEIPHSEYSTFGDITRKMRELLEIHRTKPGKSRLHQRRQAVLARNSVFIGE
ncbi:MAG TPA: 2-hydroxy-3-keto-5-methylthiopentenyl-1-phosphate phosphatase [Bacteroidota bacterium]|nr:2-hydroxy-3-keto-5-methylthiopentenyl-1-phosphate phosphatase [Bacteroidota bacterium]